MLICGIARAADRFYLQVGDITHPNDSHYPNEYEAGLGFDLPWHWDDGKLGSQLDIGVGYTQTQVQDSWRALVMPVLRYQPSAEGSGPFVELGVGLTYLDHTVWAPGYDLDTHMQFEDRLGLGYTFGLNELSLNLTHFSNGGTKQPNPGAETVSVRFSRIF
jgi:hypothetical protein